MYYSRAPSSLKPPGPWRFLPAIGALRDYSFGSLRADLLAGVTVAAVAVPQAIAYAMIAGLPAENGLYTAVVTTFVGALFYSSRQLVSGPTNAISIATLSVLAPLTTPETLVPTAILLAFMVGTLQLSITALRLGDLSRYISHSVILGFTAGAGALLMLEQLKNLFGVVGRGNAHDGFLLRFYETWSQAPSVHLETTLLGLGSIAAVVLLRWLKRVTYSPLVPDLLIVVVGTAALTAWLDLPSRGVAVVGEIPAHLPKFSLPQFSVARMSELSSGAFAVALLSLLESISMAKAIAVSTRQRLDMNQQCMGEGMANLVGSFFQCYPGSGSLMRSYINRQAGAVSQWAAVFSAIAVGATMLLFAPYARYIPRAALAGILVVAAFRMVDWQAFVYHVRATRFDAVIVAATAVSAVVISVEFCVIIGVFLSFMLAVPRVGHILLTEFVVASHGGVHERLPTDEPCPQILIFGLEGEMFFGAASSLEKQLLAIDERITDTTKVLLLRVKRARNPDAVGLSLLEQFLSDMKERGVKVLLCGVRTDLLRRFEQAKLTERLDPSQLYVEQPVRQTSTTLALRHAYELIPERCAHCPRKLKTKASYTI
jgi:SulP family sulfate permease